MRNVGVIDLEFFGFIDRHIFDYKRYPEDPRPFSHGDRPFRYSGGTSVDESQVLAYPIDFDASGVTIDEYFLDETDPDERLAYARISENISGTLLPVNGGKLRRKLSEVSGSIFDAGRCTAYEAQQQ